MGARSYVPQLGRFLQTDPVSGGSNNPYAYTNGDPVNESDLTGQYVENDYLGSVFEGQNNQAIELEKAREQAAREEAERKAAEAAAIAAADASFELSEEGPEEEYWEEDEEEGEEYAAYDQGTGHAAEREGGQGPQSMQLVEGGVFFQALQGENQNPEGLTISRSMIHLCEQDLGRKTCMSYVGFFGWLKKQVKSKWNWLKKAAKSTWKAVRASIENTFHTLGYGDLLCYQTGCEAGAALIYDGYECGEEGDCEAFSQDISEYI